MIDGQAFAGQFVTEEDWAAYLNVVSTPVDTGTLRANDRPLLALLTGAGEHDDLRVVGHRLMVHVEAAVSRLEHAEDLYVTVW